MLRALAAADEGTCPPEDIALVFEDAFLKEMSYKSGKTTGTHRCFNIHVNFPTFLAPAEFSLSFSRFYDLSYGFWVVFS